MSNGFDANGYINGIFEKLENFLKTETVIGEPLKIGDVTIIPFINVFFGLGSGGGEDSKSPNGGGGGGAGAKITPSAVLVIRGDQVELLPIKKTGGLDKLIDMVPDIIEKVKDSKCCE